MPLEPDDIFTLTKAVWAHDDFEQMGWHDVVIHAFSFDSKKFELLFDIDYIFAWVDPEPPSVGYSFWISPATLVFQNISTFSAELDGIETQILDIRRENPRPPRNVEFIPLKTEWDWTIQLVHGELCFPAAGFTQIIRRLPARNKVSQSFTPEERGGVSFSRHPCEILGTT